MKCDTLSNRSNNNLGRVTSTYTYDAFGRRIGKLVEVPSDTGWQELRTHDFIYDGFNLVQEVIYDASDNVTVIHYFWGPYISGSLEGAGDIGGLIAVSIDGDFYIPIYDFSGNIVKYISGTGATVAEYTYDAFGNLLNSTDTIGFRHRFSTKYYDPETGLYYYGFRYYSPTTQRWISRDPIEEQGGINLYSLCRNSPNLHIDPFGMDRYCREFSFFELRWHVGVAVDRWELITINECFAWKKTGTVNIDFRIDTNYLFDSLMFGIMTKPVSLFLLLVLLPANGEVVYSESGDFDHYRRISSSPEQDIAMFKQINSDGTPFYNLVYNNCIIWSHKVIKYGMNELPMEGKFIKGRIYNEKS